MASNFIHISFKNWQQKKTWFAHSWEIFKSGSSLLKNESSKNTFLNVLTDVLLCRIHTFIFTGYIYYYFCVEFIRYNTLLSFFRFFSICVKFFSTFFLCRYFSTFSSILNICRYYSFSVLFCVDIILVWYYSSLILFFVNIKCSVDIIIFRYYYFSTLFFIDFL
jgi:hypothetical protein